MRVPWPFWKRPIRLPLSQPVYLSKDVQLKKPASVFLASLVLTAGLLLPVLTSAPAMAAASSTRSCQTTQEPRGTRVVVQQTPSARTVIQGTPCAKVWYQVYDNRYLLLCIETGSSTPDPNATSGIGTALTCTYGDLRQGGAQFSDWLRANAYLLY